MVSERNGRRSVSIEQLEQRWLLTGSAVASGNQLLDAPQTPLLVDANAITSIVATALADAPAGDPIYMKYGDIKGDVTTPGFEGDIQLNSFQWGLGRGISSPMPTGGRETSSPSVSDIVVTKDYDVSSVPLIQEAFAGGPTDVEIDFVTALSQAKPQIYLKLDLSATLISGYSMSSGGGLPSESLSLNFTKINVYATDAKGRSPSLHI